MVGQGDRLAPAAYKVRIEHIHGDVDIVVYNRAVLLFTTE